MASSAVLWLCVLLCASSILNMSWAHVESRGQEQQYPCQESEKAALQAFYSFSGFSRLDSIWPSANRTLYCACDWFGVKCDEQGFIVSLNLYDPAVEPLQVGSFNLSKSVATVPWPRLLATLGFLKELRMDGFYHASPLPQEVGLLSQSLTALMLTSCGLLPPLPAEALSNLSKLTHLDLSYQGPLSLDSPIPQHICNISSLQYLNLSENYFRANIPPCIGSLPSLSYLDLSSNTLQGPVPKQIWGVRASNLTYLDLSENILSGHISPAVSIAKKMSTLDLTNNNLKGSIPESIGELLELTFMKLAFNSFTGSIPASLGNITKLKVLDLAINMLSGEIPHQLGHLVGIDSLDVSGNQLSGRIPISLGQIGVNGTGPMAGSVYLSLSSNNLTGDLPWTLLTSSCISVVDASFNQLTGITAYDSSNTFALRSSVNTSSLQYLSVASNSLTGAIPSMIGHLSALSSLYLSDNHLESGSFQDSGFPNFTGLWDITLDSNNIKDIPFWLARQSSLNYRVSLSYNKLAGTIPAWFWSLPAEIIDVSMNKLGGDIRLDALCALGSSTRGFYGSHNQFTRIQTGSETYNNCTGIFLDLQSNLLSGVVPWHAGSNVTNNVFWDSLVLADNNFFGTLPEFRCGTNVDQITAIYGRHLDLSRNRLSGTIPTTIYRLGLTLLRLSFNNFSGAIPSSLCTHYPDVRSTYLELNSNSLSGSIPHKLGLCTNTLEFLVLRDNMLTGLLPWELSNLAWLTVLDLSHNMVTGSFPNWERSSLTKSLGLLDLSHNHLQGGIPCWVLEMQSLHVLILSHNAFSGALPATRWNSTQLHVLDLSSNKLSGGIPSHSLSLLQGFLYNSSLQTQSDTLLVNVSIAIQAKGGSLVYTYVLKALVSLDLSDNALTGTVPAELGFLDGLVFLNLAHNRLSGAIPDSLGKLHQLNSLDLSSNELEGEIPKNALCSLTFLSVVNLSYNQLRGPIPQCGQWSTFSRQSFLGNSGLCGLQSEQQQSCDPDDQDSSSAPSADDINADDEDNHEFWLGILVGLSATFPVVFWLSILWGPIRNRISKASAWVLLKFGVYHY